MKKLLLATVATFGMTSGVLAADLYTPVPEPAPSASWTGFYVGGGFGAGWADYSVNTTSCDAIDLGGTCNNEGPGAPKGDGSFELYSNSLSGSGLLGTIQAGYDFQMNESLVLGIMGDYTWLDVGDSAFNHVEYLPQFTDTAGQAWSADVDNMITIAGRLGFLVMPNMMLYGLVGWSWADVNTSYFEGCGGAGGCDDIVASGSSSQDGLTVGGGFEAMIFENWSGRLEYRYTDLGKTTLYGEDDGGNYSAQTVTDTEV